MIYFYFFDNTYPISILFFRCAMRFCLLLAYIWLKKASFPSLGAVFALLVSLWCLYMLYSQLTRYFSLHMSWTLSCFVSQHWPIGSHRLPVSCWLGFRTPRTPCSYNTHIVPGRPGYFGHSVYAASCDGRLSSCCRGPSEMQSTNKKHSLCAKGAD